MTTPSTPEVTPMLQNHWIDIPQLSGRSTRHLTRQAALAECNTVIFDCCDNLKSSVHTMIYRKNVIVYVRPNNSISFDIGVSGVRVTLMRSHKQHSV